MHIGYLLPTRERVMRGEPETGPLLDLAERAKANGYDSVWVGDSLLAKPRHEPLSLLAAVAGRVPGIGLGTAVLLPALRNPVLLAHQAATIDRISEGRLILGVGVGGDIPAIRREYMAAGVPFEKRGARMMELINLARALWTGEAVDWDGRWTVEGGVLGPTPHRPGGPPIWGGGSAPTPLRRAGRELDGWFPSGPNAEVWAAQWQEVQAQAADAGRDPASLAGAIYLTLSLDDNAATANARIDAYLEAYYSQAAAELRRRQAHYAGPAAGLDAYLAEFAEAGVDHMVCRFAGDHHGHMDELSTARQRLGWLR